MIQRKGEGMVGITRHSVPWPSLAGAAPVMLWTAGPDKQYTFFNDEWLRFTGRGLAAELGEGWAEGLHPEDRNRCIEIRSIAFDARQPCQTDYRLRRSDGEYRWLRDRAVPWYGDAGTFLGYIGSAWDVTDLVVTRTEIQLAASVFEHANEGMVITDADENIIAVNRSFTRITGYQVHEVIGRRPNILSSGRTDPAIYQQMHSSLTTVGSWAGEIWNRRKDGEIYPERLSIRAVYDARGKVSHYVGMFIDVSDLRQARDFLVKAKAELESQVERRTAELKIAMRELETFSYSVSHDLRAPLRAIDGYSALLQQDCGHELGEPQRAHLDRIRAAVARMAQLIDDLLELSRVTRRELAKTEVDLSGMAREIASGLREREPGRKVQFDIAEGAVVIGDPVLLRAAMENLLGNAWKYTSKKADGCIQFGSAERSGRREFFVRDNGAGFDMGTADRLFKPFQRLHTDIEFPGTGIGLATVARIIERHGGEVWAQGETGKGASFNFTL